MIVEERRDFPADEGVKIIDLLFGAKYAAWCYEREVRITQGGRRSMRRRGSTL